MGDRALNRSFEGTYRRCGSELSLRSGRLPGPAARPLAAGPFFALISLPDREG